MYRTTKKGSDPFFVTSCPPSVRDVLDGALVEQRLVRLQVATHHLVELRVIPRQQELRDLSS